MCAALCAFILTGFSVVTARFQQELMMSMLNAAEVNAFEGPPKEDCKLKNITGGLEDPVKKEQVKEMKDKLKATKSEEKRQRVKEHKAKSKGNAGAA